MNSSVELSPTLPLDARTLLERVNRRIVILRAAIRHDHGDAAYWSAVGMTAAEAQAARAILRMVADLLHVERAHARERLHGARFASLEAQAQWLAERMHWRCARAARLARLPVDASLARLRAGELPRDPV